MKKYLNHSQLNKYTNSLNKTRSLLGRTNLSKMSSSYGVEGNTFRAYSGWKETPSSVYREWAAKRTKSIEKSPPTKLISTYSDYRKWHKNLSTSLNNFWNKRQGGSLSLAHCYKLIDLYVKWISQFNFYDEKFINNLNKYASCALDGQIIKKINLCYGNCLPINNPRMGDILNQNTYDYCQDMINEFCKAGGGTRLEFDFWAWKKGG